MLELLAQHWLEKYLCHAVALPGLINKTWQVFHLSPLFGFSSQPQTLRQFSRSLTAFIVMVNMLFVWSLPHNGLKIRECLITFYSSHMLLYICCFKLVAEKHAHIKISFNWHYGYTPLITSLQGSTLVYNRICCLSCKHLSFELS